MLLLAVRGFFGRVPADGGRIEEDFGPLHRGEAGGFRIPLIPAYERADFPVTGLPGAKAEVAGREIEFLVVKRVVRDVHFAVLAEQRSIRVDDDRGIVIN